MYCKYFAEICYDGYYVVINLTSKNTMRSSE